MPSEERSCENCARYYFADGDTGCCEAQWMLAEVYDQTPDKSYCSVWQPREK